MRIKVLKKLQSISEEKYKNFSLKLLPENTKLLGVRVPLIKKMAKQIKKNNESHTYLCIPLKQLEYQEEKMLFSLLIAYQDIAEEIRVENIKKYVSYISNWSECDTFSSALKTIKYNSEFYYNNFLSYTQSTEEYEVRFFYVVATNYFINDTYLFRILELIKKQKYNGFYDRMAVAWFLSMAFVKYEDEIKKYLKNTRLDTMVYQKTLSKINDSYQIKKEVKQELKSYLTKSQ
ncbi:MAG: DNA alkylation repair protein [Alphaproteobacteria bacterium]|nr:DNA alkylation repair protein [Alphaproteobacteria bacterium]